MLAINSPFLEILFRDFRAIEKDKEYLLFSTNQFLFNLIDTMIHVVSKFCITYGPGLSKLIESFLTVIFFTLLRDIRC